LKNHPNANTFWIDYSVWVWKKMGNMVLAMSHLKRLQGREQRLGWFDQIRLFNVCLKIRKTSNLAAKHSYQRRLDIEAVIEAEEQIV